MSMTRKCYVVSGDKETPAKFYGVFQVAKVVGESPFIGGHSAGQVMEPVAVVEYNGQLHKAYLDQVHFEDVEVRDDTRD
jgi:hypothetical protein